MFQIPAKEVIFRILNCCCTAQETLAALSQATSAMPPALCGRQCRGELQSLRTRIGVGAGRQGGQPQGVP